MLLQKLQYYQNTTENYTNHLIPNWEDIDEEIPGSSFDEELFQCGKVHQNSTTNYSRSRLNNLWTLYSCIEEITAGRPSSM